MNNINEYIKKFKDLNINDAEEFAKMSDLTIRITKKDGLRLIVTRDYRINRVNVEVKDDVIIKVMGIG
ncbi:MAG: hypothetical protein WC523_04505 [Patescibacteria group bacterium]